MHKPSETQRDGDMHARGNEFVVPGKDHDVFRRFQVRAGISGVFPLRGVVIIRNDLDVQCVLLHWCETRVVKLIRHRDRPRSAATVLRHNDVCLPRPFVVLVLRVRSVDQKNEISVLL